MAPTIMPATKPNPPRLLARHVDRYLELDKERAELRRKSRAMAEEQSQLAEIMLENVRHTGQPITKAKHVIAIKQKPNSVSWKAEFVRVAGADKADKIAAKAGRKDVLAIAPIG